MSGTGEEEDGGRSPRSKSPAMGVSGLLREQQKDDPSSPCPSDRLSVTWADGERSVSSDAVSLVPRGPLSPDQPSINTLIPACGSLLEEPAEDDFNASVSAILKRSNSKGSRRGSKKRKKMRRTSTMTTSSGEIPMYHWKCYIGSQCSNRGVVARTVVEMEESTADEVAETLRIHKEVLAGVNQQPWPIARKLRLARTAQEYIKRHEGELEERLAHSSSTKDVLLRYFILVRRLVRAGVQAVYQWVTGLEPWQGRIKTIESHFGSAVASYFTFLRWVLGLNIALTALLAAFVIIPEFLAADRSGVGERKAILAEDRISAYDFKVMWDFEGILRFSPIFYGYYSKTPTTREGYRLPLAYFLTSLAVYAYSFIAILRKMAANSRMSKLAEDEECTFSWRLLAGWDFTIGNLEAAQNKVAAINTGFREALLEAKESEKEEKSWKLRARRMLAHLIVLLLIIGSAYAVVLLVRRSEGVDASSSWYRQNELTIILTLISMIYPNLFDLVGLLEVRHPRNQLQWQLARIMALNLLNLYTLIFALFSKVDDMTCELGELKTNLTETFGVTTTMDLTSFTTTPFFINNTNSSWSPYNDTDPSTLSDLLTTVSLSLPTVSPDPATLATTEGHDFNFNFSSSLGTTLLTAATILKGIPLVKTDPRLSSLPPGCRLVLAPCPVTTAVPADMTPNIVTPMSTTSDYYDLLKASVDRVAEDLSPYDETAYVYDDDNVTTPKSRIAYTPASDSVTLTDSPTGINVNNTLSNVTYLKGEVLESNDSYSMNNSMSGEDSSTFKIITENVNRKETTEFTSLTTYGTRESTSATEVTTSEFLDETELSDSGDGVTISSISSPAIPFSLKLQVGRETSSVDQNIGDKERVKRVINDNDYADLGMEIPDSPKFGLEINLEPNLEAKNFTRDAVNKTSSNYMNNFDSGEAKRYNFTTPDVYHHLSTRDQDSYWNRILSNLLSTEGSNTPESLASEDVERGTQSTTKYESWRETTATLEGEDVVSVTEGPDQAVDEDHECYISVCDEPTEDTHSTSMATSPSPSSSVTSPPPTLSTTSSTSTEAPTTTITSTELVSSTIVVTETPLYPPLTTPEPPSFLVQPMKNNPEKWVPLMPSRQRQRLRKLCWETMFGQEIIKLTVMDMVVTVVTIVIGDYIRAVVVRLFNGCCCWDLEKQFPGYPDFKIAENILHLVNNQGMIWMGMFFSPGLPALNTIKLVVLLYVRSWAVVTSNVPPETVFKASNNNNFYLLFLLTMLFLCTLPVGYAAVWLEPSWHCGPFSDYPRIYQLATSTLIGGLPSSLYPVIDYISSPGVVIPAGMLLVLIIYYLLSLTAALREANSDLRDQLRQERSAEKRKVLDARSGKGRPETPTTRWSRVVPLTPMPRPRLDATSDPEKPINKKSATAISPEGDNGQVVPLCDPPRDKDDGPWPDDVTDLGHSEVFDDSLSEPRRTGKDTPNTDKVDVGMAGQESKKYEKNRGKEVEKEKGKESAPRSPYSRPKNRHNNYSQLNNDDDEINLSRAQRGRHRTSGSLHKTNRMSQERKQSDENGRRDSPTKTKPGHRQSIDSPKERRRKGSGPQSSKLKSKMPEECVQELHEVLQQKEAKQGKSPKVVSESELQKVTEPETPTKVASQARHRREPSIMKMEDIRRNSQSKNNQQKMGAQPGHHRSSSEDSQSMQTIPVIKISKEDSVERSLQQAKLERQEKTLEEDLDTASDQQSLSNTDTASLPPEKKKDDSIENKNVGKDHASKGSPSKHKPAPTETDLDDPYILECGDTAALLGEYKKDKDEGKQEESDEPPGTLTSDEETTLLDD
ncbi:uncharacterized protein LOC121855437 [Homarus americanus]|uniref:uncharacterized protein LOC121855437 n=1 Tax=Homarus americanus TaxID=6706 RepID=UPI001C4520BE|nr:uncharacterized protein LOC121855437 [Homarus americanus]